MNLRKSAKYVTIHTQIVRNFGTNAEAIAFRTEDMKGWFINFHTSCCGTAIPPNAQIAKEYAELISNRFAEARPVNPAGKISAVWARMKSLR